MRITIFLIVSIFFFAAGAQGTGDKAKNGEKQSSDHKGVRSIRGLSAQDPQSRYVLIDEEERDELLGLLFTSLDYYLDRIMDSTDEEMTVRKSEEEIMSDLHAMVDDIESRYDYHVDEKFSGFSQDFRAKTQSVMRLNWRLLPETEENGTKEEQYAVAERYVTLQIAQMKDISRRELEEYVLLHVFRELEEGEEHFISEPVQILDSEGLVEVVAPLIPYDFHIYKQEVIDIGIYQSPELATFQTADGRIIRIDSIMKINNEKMNELGEQLIRLEKQMAELKERGRSYVDFAEDLGEAKEIELPVDVEIRRSTKVRDEPTVDAKSTKELFVFRFQKNSDALSYSDRIKLVDVAIRMMEDPEMRVSITGFADRSGTPALNARISKARADGVRDYLLSKYIAEERMKVDYLGASQSDSENSDDRKVEVELIWE